mmetsp:Transcript_38398/g.89271  ORF Transcript_38398/g.89271 Transcript_38398/m.89271 type:complete len:234 (+) Transcript_38398:302-1003(+)
MPSATANRAHEMTPLNTGAPRARDNATPPAAAATADPIPTAARVSGVELGSSATAPFRFTSAAAVVHPKCSAMGKKYRTYCPNPYVLVPDAAAHAASARPRLQAVAASMAVLTIMPPRTAEYFSRKDAHHRDWNTLAAAKGSAIFRNSGRRGWEGDRTKAAVDTDRNSPRKMGPQMAKAHPAGVTSDRPVRGDKAAASSDTSAAVPPASSASMALATSPSMRPGRETEMTFRR